MIRSLVPTVLAAAVALAASSASAFEIVGLYSTNEGQLSLYRAESGSYRWLGDYGDDGGRIEANQIEHDIITGYWMENSSAVRCDTERGGTYYWGRMAFYWTPSIPLPAGAFQGRWGYCDESTSHEWIGIRLESNG
jgi:hypothetical protein